MQREDRYLVLKFEDAEEALTDDELHTIDTLIAKYSAYRTSCSKPNKNYVVVAEDWPMYETVWKMIEMHIDEGHDIFSFVSSGDKLKPEPDSFTHVMESEPVHVKVESSKIGIPELDLIYMLITAIQSKENEVSTYDVKRAISWLQDWIDRRYNKGSNND